MLLLPLAAVAQDYAIGPGDVVKITVYEHPDLATTARVTAAGKIGFPLIGQLDVGGKTPVEVERALESQLTRGGYVKNPLVTVMVEEYVSQQVAVLGQVKKPDRYALQGTMSVLDLISMAGGRTEDASDEVTLIHNQDGEKKVYRVDLLSFFTGDLSQNIAVSGGDVVLVPRMDVFYIYGEVQQPGVYRLERDMTVMQALSVGGGLTQRGTQNGIRVKRRKAGGGVDEIKVDLNDSLKPNDVVYVKESLF